jgi:soluble lytic murein transglycosylase-like protein
MRIGILALTSLALTSLALTALALIEPAMAREPSPRHAALWRQHDAQAHHGYRHRAVAHRRARRARISRRHVVAPPPPAFFDWRSPQAAEPIAAPSRMAIERPVTRRRLRVEATAPDSVFIGAPRGASSGAFDSAIARHAQANGVPEHLVRRVIVRESRYNARAVGRGGAMGLMQIKHATARSMGYSGSAGGLLDAETNLTYAVRYLAGAYRAAGGNPNRAVAYYASGYHGRGAHNRRRGAR